MVELGDRGQAERERRWAKAGSKTRISSKDLHNPVSDYDNLLKLNIFDFNFEII
jgi:hypothetical protein